VIKKPDSQSQNLASEEGDEKRIELLLRNTPLKTLSASTSFSSLIEQEPKISLVNFDKNPMFFCTIIKFLMEKFQNFFIIL